MTTRAFVFASVAHAEASMPDAPDSPRRIGDLIGQQLRGRDPQTVWPRNSAVSAVLERPDGTAVVLLDVDAFPEQAEQLRAAAVRDVPARRPTEDEP